MQSCIYFPPEIICMGFLILVIGGYILMAITGVLRRPGSIFSQIALLAFIASVIWALYSVRDGFKNPDTGQFDNGTGCAEINYPFGK